MSLFSRTKVKYNGNGPTRKEMARKLMSTWGFHHMPTTSPKYEAYDIRQAVKRKGNLLKASVKRQASKIKEPPVIMHIYMGEL